MKKILSLLFVLTTSLSCIIAQQSNLVYSEKFPKPENAYSKIKLLKNGNTALLQFTIEEGITFHLYDSKKKKIWAGPIPLTLIKKEKGGWMSMGKYPVKGMFEINGDVMLMVSGYIEKTPVLYRLLFSGTTGKLKKEEKIFELPPLGNGVGVGYATEIGGVSMPGFEVEKDPNSDYYAVLLFNSFAKETSKRIEIVHFSPAHQQINRAFFNSPEGNFKYLNWLSFYVNGGNYVVLAAQAYNTKASGGKKSIIYLSKLEEGSTVFNSKPIPYTDSFKSECEFVIDKKSGTINVTLKNYLTEESKGYVRKYEMLIQPFNPDKMELYKTFNPTLQKANVDYHKLRPKDKEDYAGMPQNYIVDQTGSNLFLNEAAQIVTKNDNAFLELSNIAITSLASDGKENYGFIIPYGHSCVGTASSYLYFPQRKGAVEASFYDLFRGSVVDLVPGKKFNYLFLNNTMENIIGEKSSILRYNASNLNAYCYKMDNKTGDLTKYYFFGNPAGETFFKYCVFQASDFNPETGEYAALVVEQGPKKGENISSIVWTTLE